MNLRRDLPVNRSDVSRRWAALSPEDREVVVALGRLMVRYRVLRELRRRGVIR